MIILSPLSADAFINGKDYGILIIISICRVFGVYGVFRVFRVFRIFGVLLIRGCLP